MQQVMSVITEVCSIKIPKEHGKISHIENTDLILYLTILLERLVELKYQKHVDEVRI